MIEIISSYVRNIAVFLIFMGFVGVIAPDGKYKSYINLTLGFILVLIVIGPILNILNGGFDALLSDISFSGLGFSGERTVLASDYNHSEGLQNKMILDAYKEKLEEQLMAVVWPHLKKSHSYESGVFQVGEGSEDFGEIFAIQLVLAEGRESGEPPPLIYIEPIVIGDKKLPDSLNEPAEEDSYIKNLKKVISDFYNITSSNIYIIVQKMD